MPIPGINQEVPNNNNERFEKVNKRGCCKATAFKSPVQIKVGIAVTVIVIIAALAASIIGGLSYALQAHLIPSYFTAFNVLGNYSILMFSLGVPLSLAGSITLSFLIGNCKGKKKTQTSSGASKQQGTAEIQQEQVVKEEAKEVVKEEVKEEKQEAREEVQEAIKEEKQEAKAAIKEEVKEEKQVVKEEKQGSVQPVDQPSPIQSSEVKQEKLDPRQQKRMKAFNELPTGYQTELVKNLPEGRCQAFAIAGFEIVTYTEKGGYKIQKYGDSSAWARALQKYKK